VSAPGAGRSLSFDRAAAFYDETRGGLVRGRRFADAIAARLEPASRVLEVGVGTGAVALPLTEHGHTVLGADLAPAMLAKAHERLGARVAVADAHRLPFPDAAFDAVVAVWVLHVVADRDAVVAECRRVLRPGGRLAVVPADAEEATTDTATIMGELRAALGRDRDLPHVVGGLAAAHGFTPVYSGLTEPFAFDESPNQTAREVESRTWSSLWDLDDGAWAARVQPFLDRLAALPEPDRPRRRRQAHRLLVFER
jgi:SAM-dependent methyltransferase